ncbi:caspase domain protein, putative [Candidatus Vecturithrix granuli]|uniref:Caspase domain protein, putative n=1 Tax=Vecturithrix granuli TaxID=1499967 RepID=A0A081C2J3_VECG1|nr:caspase domain protein, putative [Candidatus Vecturithrix granuli]
MHIHGESQAQAGGQLFDHGYALLIGVGTTADPRWSLPVTVNDVQAIHKILTDAALCAYPHNRDHIRLLCNAAATRPGILDGLAWLKRQAAADPDATVVVYYSGHGWLDAHALQYALIPHEFDATDIPGSALLANDFAAALREIEARRLVVFVDSCHAEGMAAAKGEPGLPADFVQAVLPKGVIDCLKQGEGRAVFTSSRGRQSSYIRPDQSMSIYTYHLLAALQGAGSSPGDTVVRVSNLMNHLGKTVPASARQCWQVEQVPFFDAATEDFPVALLRGGKGLPAEDRDDAAQATAESPPTPQKTGERIRIHQEAGDNAVQIGLVHGDANIRKT